MDKMILLAISDDSLALAVGDLLEGIYRDAAFEKEGREERAIEKLKHKTYSLVVILYIPPGGHTPLQEADARGVQLVKWILDDRNEIPVMLLINEMNDHVVTDLDRLKGRGKCEYVEISSKLNSLLAIRARELMGDAQRPEEEKRLDVVIYLDPDRGYFDLRGDNLYKEHRPLKIHRSALISLTEEADKMVDDEDNGPWLERLQKIGEELMRQIFESNPDFQRLFWSHVTLAGGLCNTRLRFSLNEKNVHRIALEALYGCYEGGGDDKGYWMLHTPIYRTISSSGGYTHPLFDKDDREMKNKPINILIIESPAAGTFEVDELREITLRDIPNVREECKFLTSYFLPGKKKGSAWIGEVKRIPERNNPKPFRQQLQDALEGHAWHIVHYAGHSDAIGNDGYIFLSKQKGKAIEPVELKEFAGWLNDVHARFVYLSSCHSSDAGFVFALAKKNVPAIVGFRWDIDDDRAAEYTKAFYVALFEGERPSLEYAFLKARQNMYKDVTRENPIWAAPILVIQRPLRS